METARVDWSMGSRAAKLVDWGTAADVGRRVGGRGPALQAVERARLREDLAETVPRAESLVSAFTGLSADGFRSRPWVMSRGEWVATNLRGLQRLLEPLAQRILAENAPRSDVRRKALGAQIGVLLGYVSKKVLGQYDVFLPPDDEGLLYFVGPNLAETERRFALPPHDFRLWVAIHEVTHRVQFGATPWLRGSLNRMVGTYLDTVQVDAREMLAQLRRALAETRGTTEWRSVNIVLMLMTPEQRELFHRMQAMMSLLEGHASFVMDEVARDHVRDLPRMKRSLKERRTASGLERTFQRAIGFDSKIRQYSAGEYFVRAVHQRAGMDTLNLVWRDEGNLPTIQEIGEPQRWLARVAER
ncbi:MAG: zinc-dependent metalloprotease [Candidatus Velamenicoccus archaeovorus]